MISYLLRFCAQRQVLWITLSIFSPLSFFKIQFPIYLPIVQSTLCPQKNAHIFIFQITLSTINRF